MQIATVNSVASNTAGVAVFSPNLLSWNSYSNTMSAAMGKFMDWTRADFEAFFLPNPLMHQILRKHGMPYPNLVMTMFKGL